MFYHTKFGFPFGKIERTAATNFYTASGDSNDLNAIKTVELLFYGF
jgi:hypothetical protein